MGTLLGAVTGALIGQETESGFIRGAAVGAISGAVFSIEVFESSLLLWKSNESRFGCLLYLVRASWKLLCFLVLKLSKLILVPLFCRLMSLLVL